MLDMGKQSIPHGFHQSFRSFGIVDTEGILADHLHHRHCQNGQGHDPKMLSQIRKSAHCVYRTHDKGWKASRLAT